MRREGPSITFTVYFDGQFWVGTVERVEEGGLSAARVVFGAEPSEEEILKFILERWDTLRFSPEVEAERRREPGNPKRRQREAAKAAAKAGENLFGFNTAEAQQAIAEMREQGKAAARKKSAAERRETASRKRALRSEKRKEKHRGH